MASLTAAYRSLHSRLLTTNMRVGHMFCMILAAVYAPLLSATGQTPLCMNQDSCLKGPWNSLNELKLQAISISAE